MLESAPVYFKIISLIHYYIVIGTQVKQTGTEHYVPALTRYKTVHSAGMLDITNRNCGPWLQRQLKNLVEKYQFDAFYLDMGMI